MTDILNLPDPPSELAFDGIFIRFEHIAAGDESRGLVPYYHYLIFTRDGAEVGHINFRVGDTAHVRLYAGHIGYQIQESFRGHAYSLQACCALAPFVRSIYPAVIITTDPENLASTRIIERLGAAFIEEVTVPPHDPQYERGSRIKRRYRWEP